MVVVVDETRDDGAAMHVDRLRAARRAEPAVADRGDAVVDYAHGLNDAVRGVHRVDRAVGDQHVANGGAVLSLREPGSDQQQRENGYGRADQRVRGTHRSSSRVDGSCWI